VIHVLLATSISKQMLMQTTLNSDESQITIDIVTGKHIKVCAAFSNENTPCSTYRNDSNGQCEQQGMKWLHMNQNGAPLSMAQPQ
jgi:hypothetical protein